MGLHSASRFAGTDGGVVRLGGQGIRVSAAIPRWAFLIFLLWTPLPLGSNRPLFWLCNALFCALIQGALLIAHPAPMGPVLRRLSTAIWVGALLLVAWALFQAANWSPSAWHHPVWTELNRDASGAISINPSASFA